MSAVLLGDDDNPTRPDAGARRRAADTRYRSDSDAWGCGLGTEGRLSQHVGAHVDASTRLRCYSLRFLLLGQVGSPGNRGVAQPAVTRVPASPSQRRDDTQFVFPGEQVTQRRRHSHDLRHAIYGEARERCSPEGPSTQPPSTRHSRVAVTRTQHEAND